MAAPADAPAAPSALPGPSPRALIAVIAGGIFVTGFALPKTLGYLPFSLLLKNGFHMSALQVQAFWSFSLLLWYVKPFVGFVCDAYPLLGTRRRGYLLVATLMAGLTWLAFLLVPHAYKQFLALMTLLNLAMVVVSTAIGGLQIEVAHHFNATGRLASLRTGLEGIMDLIGGPVGGWLAICALRWTAITGAVATLAFLPVVYCLYREPGGARANTEVFAVARKHLQTIVRSRAMWGATGLLFLVYLAPGFQLPMLYYQQDVLKLDPRFIGFLQLLGGVGGIIGATAYGYICRRFSLKVSLIAGIVLNATSTLLYLRYDSAGKAALIDGSAALLGTLATLPLYDLAARATPRGIESFGFSLMMSIRNVSIFVISGLLGSYLYDHYHMSFKQLVWLNAGSSAAVLLFVPLLPAALLATREESSGQPPAI
ncbi:MAG TPA: MFS transporter [Polyangia bacterium]|jgi:MFS family permease|nr:MFS transporter [Polyangia bacterium]